MRVVFGSLDPAREVAFLCKTRIQMCACKHSVFCQAARLWWKPSPSERQAGQALLWA